MARVQIQLDQCGRTVARGSAGREPVATVAVEMKEAEPCVALELQGVISGASAQRLAEFLALASQLVAARWTLQMQGLAVLSGRGLQSLIGFARLIGRRGSKLEIIGISESVHATLRDLNLIQAFGWAD
ncbi:MAG: hypothetical protein DKINENOH_00655 [bacterium]|nr:hypothetical protein [bacterium]MCK6559172.1 STAS domain-containing protein [bacterium]NUM67251.1 STAS domain-containing protein [candidate division KSB1 bacterium]